MPDAPNHKSPKKKFELKYEKIKKKKKRIVTEQAASPWILKITTNGKPNIKPTTSPTDYKGSKDTDSLKKKKKKLQYTLQITKSEIIKANLKTKTSIEQRCNTSQQMDWAS